MTALFRSCVVSYYAVWCRDVQPRDVQSNNNILGYIFRNNCKGGDRIGSPLLVVVSY